MNYAEKRRFIKDPVWGEVEFFSWERELFDHPLVNRLHGVVQTSCTFKVYPSLKYSRFAHSVGALYTVTQLFVNIARNLRVNAQCASDPDDKKRCVEGSKQFGVETKLVEVHFQKVLKNDDQLEAMKDVLCCAFPVEREDALALAVVRIGALLHDLGHLPYSHLLENTMERFITFEGKDLKSLPKETARLHRELKGLADKFEKRHQNLGKFHEWLGYQFATMMANDQALAEDDQVRAFVRRSIYLARDVWSREMYDGKSKETDGHPPRNLTPILSSLLSGDIDADRIDFVKRDSYFSGLFKCSVDFSRLFDLYEAGENPSTDDYGEPTGWAARPSCRSASDASKLLIERFQLYKYAIAHHRVHLFDEMLERCLIELLRAGRLDELLGGIIGVLGLPTKRAETTIDRQAQDDLRGYLLHLDDAWVDTRVRAWNVTFGKAQPGLAGDQRCKRLFEGFLEKRDHFKSVFKWDRDFNAWWEPNFVKGPFKRCFQGWLARRKKEDKKFPDQTKQSPDVWREFQSKLQADILKACRGEIVKRLFARRYEFEKYLQEAAKLKAVIVGVTGKKVRGNMKSAEDARFFGLTSANEYLTAATLETMLFNVWFVMEDDEGKEQDLILGASLAWLERELLCGPMRKDGKTTMFEAVADDVWNEFKGKD